MMNRDDVAYLEALRKQIETTLRQREAGGYAEKMAQYSRLVLVQLISQATHLPALHRTALRAFAGLIDELQRAIGGDVDLMRAIEHDIRIEPDFDKAQRVLQLVAGRLVADNNSASRTLLGKIARIEDDMLREFDRAVISELAREQEQYTGPEGLSLDQLQRLEAYLRQKYPEDPQLHIDIAGTSVIPGGFSKQTIFLQLRKCNSLPPTVVLRVEQGISVLGTAVELEFPILEAMYKAGVPVPQPYFVETDPSVIGSSFIMLSLMPGRNIGDPFDVREPSRTFGLSLARAMARLHAVAPESVGSRIDGANVTVKERMLADIVYYEASWRSCNDPSIQLEMAYGWLKQNIHLAEGRRSVIHRDIGCHNLLVQDGQVSAILDWELAAIGDPAQDLGCAYSTVVQVMPWDEFLAEYVGAGGHAPSEAQVDFYRIWRETFLLWTVVQSRARLKAGLGGDIALVYVAVNAAHILAVRLQALLCKVTAIG
jgi:aminoglycoside phosphotransferase (APT) family kinase protein